MMSVDNVGYDIIEVTRAIEKEQLRRVITEDIDSLSVALTQKLPNNIWVAFYFLREDWERYLASYKPTETYNV